LCTEEFYDPQVPFFKIFFDNNPEKFPTQPYDTDAWLSFLRLIGLQGIEILNDVNLIKDYLTLIMNSINEFYDASTQTCIPCISGWVFNNKSCFKGVGPLTISNTFESILQSDIGSMCSNLYTINVDLAVATDFNSYSIIDSVMCSNTNKIDRYFFGPIQSGSNCELYNCASGYDPSHGCSHYSSHGIICKYS
jgi:hypothetical protein